MTREEWTRIKEIAAAAWDRPDAERGRFIATACAEDERLRVHVESLLSSAQAAATLYEAPALITPGGAEAFDAATRSHPAAVGTRIGPYRVTGELGHGGMGSVYLAERVDGEFDQRVAIKFVAGVPSRPLLERFRDERRILASLTHPHIASLIDGGSTAAGVPYVIMEYVPGTPIDAYCEARGLRTRDRIDLFLKVCDAVQHAHERSVIHRDIKSGNILVTADGTPKLLDFGIAKILDHDAHSLRRTTAVRALTPDSASPEQIRNEPITAASDVYALGVLLYRLLTRRSPYGDKALAEPLLRYAICEVVPKPPSVAALRANGSSNRSDRIDHDLDSIVLRALRKEPGQRYSSVEELAHDLRRYLAGHPVVAAPDSWRYRTGKFLQRHRVSVAVAGAAVVATIAGGAVAWLLFAPRQGHPAATSPNVHRVAVLGEDRQRVLRRRTTNPEAYDAYLRGRYFWNTRTPDGFQKALGYFEEAIARDPTYAPAYAGLADTYALLGSNMYAMLPPSDAATRATAAATRALEIDDTLAEAHASLALVTSGFRWEWTRGEQMFRRAIELDPDYATAHYWYAQHLGRQGRLEEALDEAQRALALDPLSLVGTYVVGLVHYYARRYEPAHEYTQRALEMSPDFPPARRLLGWLYLVEGRYTESTDAFRRLRDAMPAQTAYEAWLAHAYGRAGKHTVARRMLRQLADTSKTRYVSAAHIGVGYAGVGDRDAAFRWLERAYAEHSEGLAFLGMDPMLDSLRTDPRFADLIRRVGLSP